MPLARPTLLLSSNLEGFLIAVVDSIIVIVAVKDLAQLGGSFVGTLATSPLCGM